MFKRVAEALFPHEYNTDGAFSLRLTIHRSIYFVLMLVLADSQPVSNYMMSATEILLAVNWVAEWDMRRKFRRENIHPLLVFFLVFLAVHLLWLIPTENLDYGLNDLFKKLPLFAIPLVVLTSRPLNKHQISVIMVFYVVAVFVATVIGRVRYVTMPDLPYRDIIPYISHIRFSLNVCVSIVLLVAFMVVGWRRYMASSKWYWVVEAVAASLVVLLVGFLMIVRSYTAIVILVVTGIVLLVVFWRKIADRRIKTSVLLGAAAVVGIGTWIFVTMTKDYYRLVPLATQPKVAYTVNGNPYSHGNDGMIENGNYVDDYVCLVELQSEWEKLGSLKLSDTTSNGYAVFPTLVRYLNAKGVTKDSVGIQSLTPSDVEAIEKGIANPVYITGSSVRRMVYVLLYEYESYRCLNAVKNFTVLQRLELWKNGWRVFRDNPVFGTGTGDVVDVCHERLRADNSALTGTKKHIHNQYLTLLVTFGIVGFLVIAITFVWALRKEKFLSIPFVLAYLCILLISFISEDTLETLAGAVFSVYFLCFFAVHREELSNV